MKKYLALLLLLVCSLFASAAVSVKVSSPTSTSGTLPSKVEVKASATSTKAAITRWHVYVDGVSRYDAWNKSAIDATITLKDGKHSLIVRAWDHTSAYDSYFVTITVDSTPPPPPPPVDNSPKPPAGATDIANIQNFTKWGSCDAPSCSGSTSGASGSWWFSNFNTSPSLSASSTHFHADGTAGEDVLWYTATTVPNDQGSHFIYDYWVYTTPGSTNHVIAFEHDILGVANGFKYNFSTQCHITSFANKAAHWDTYDGYNHHWKHTAISCAALLETGKWHHIKVYGEHLSDNRTHYISFTTDGVTVPVPDTYAYFQSLPTTWQSHWTLQVQIDLLTGNTGSDEYYDQAHLYVW